MNPARTAASVLTVLILGVLTPATAFPQSANPAAPADVPAAERAALAAFYYATGGAGWKKNAGRLNAADPCDWYGVSCMEYPDNVDQFVGLTLVDNGLNGTLPATFSGLACLHDLNWNAFNSLESSHTRIRRDAPCPPTLRRTQVAPHRCS